jgi:hypothetical protein
MRRADGDLRLIVDDGLFVGRVAIERLLRWIGRPAGGATRLCRLTPRVSPASLVLAPVSGAGADT